MTKLAPAPLLGLVMGIWLLAAALGSKFSGVRAGDFTSSFPAELSAFFLRQAAWVSIVAVVLLALVPGVKRRMGGAR